MLLCALFSILNIAVLYVCQVVCTCALHSALLVLSIMIILTLLQTPSWAQTIYQLKVHGPIFQNLSVLFHLNYLFKDVNFKFQLKRSSCLDVLQFCILQLPISYCVSLIMVTITRHIFINIFERKTFQLWNLLWVMRKIWTFLW